MWEQEGSWEFVKSEELNWWWRLCGDGFDTDGVPKSSDEQSPDGAVQSVCWRGGSNFLKEGDGMWILTKSWTRRLVDYEQNIWQWSYKTRMKLRAICPMVYITVCPNCTRRPHWATHLPQWALNKYTLRMFARWQVTKGWLPQNTSLWLSSPWLSMHAENPGSIKQKPPLLCPIESS